MSIGFSMFLCEERIKDEGVKLLAYGRSDDRAFLSYFPSLMNDDEPFTSWNSGRSVGPRERLDPPDICALVHTFQLHEEWHDLCLFALGIDSMLRCSDLLTLKVKDITDRYGVVVQTFNWKQDKTDNGVAPALTPTTRNVCTKWIKVSGKSPNDFLFTRTKSKDDVPITDDTYRKRVKKWLESIHIDPTDYSTHSLRRSKPHFMFRRGVKIEYISELLGHKDTSTTYRYLGITKEEAQKYALENDIYKKSLHLKSTRLISQRKHQSVRTQDYDVFLATQTEILNRLKTLEASNEKILSEVQAVRMENRAILACIKDLLTSSSKPNHGKD